MRDRVDLIRAAVKPPAKKRRTRHKAVHVSLSEAEHAEFHAACLAHGLLERELVMSAVRAYKTLPQRLELLEARVRVLEGEVTTSPRNA